MNPPTRPDANEPTVTRTRAEILWSFEILGRTRAASVKHKEMRITQKTRMLNDKKFKFPCPHPRTCYLGFIIMFQRAFSQLNFDESPAEQRQFPNIMLLLFIAQSKTCTTTIIMVMK